MMNKSFTVGIILYIVTMAIFFIVCYFFGGNNFFDIFLKVNAFLFPLVYCIAAFISVRSIWKEQRFLTFKEVFRTAFLPMFIGGLLSMITIFAFLNYIDTSAKDMLNYQFVEKNKAGLTEVYTKQRSVLKTQKEKEELDVDYQNSMKSFSPEMVKDKDVFTARHFAGYFGAITIFYLILSVFFGAFFRTKSPQ